MSRALQNFLPPPPKKKCHWVVYRNKFIIIKILKNPGKYTLYLELHNIKWYRKSIFKFLYCIIVYHSVDQKTINKGKKLEQSVYHVPDNIIWITLNTIGDPTPYTFIFIIWYFNTKKNWVTGWKTMKSSLGLSPTNLSVNSPSHCFIHCTVAEWTFSSFSSLGEGRTKHPYALGRHPNERQEDQRKHVKNKIPHHNHSCRPKAIIWRENLKTKFWIIDKLSYQLS